MSNMQRKNTQRSRSPLYWSAESWAIVTLRLFLGLRFLTAGLGKFKGADNSYSFSNYYDQIVPWITSAFAEKTNLWGFLVSPYAHGIAYVELVLGVLLLAGVKTKYVLAGIALTIVSLAFGSMLLNEGDNINQLSLLLMMTAAALYFVRHNKLESVR